MGTLGRALHQRMGLPAGPCRRGSQAGARAVGERGSAVPGVGVQWAGGKLWCRALLQPGLPPGLKCSVTGCFAQHEWLEERAETPLHAGEPSCVWGGWCWDVCESGGCQHCTRTCVHAHMPSGSTPEARLQLGERGAAGGCPLAAQGLLSGPPCQQLPACPGSELPAGCLQRAALANIEPGITNPRCGLGK